MKKDNIRHITISEFNYLLPEERIAKYPLYKRDESKLLVFGDAEKGDSNIETLSFKDLPQNLPDNTLLLLNNTKVIHARLLFKKDSGANIEIFCLSPFTPSYYAESFMQRESCAWVCMVGNSRRWKSGSLSMEIDIKGKNVKLKANRLDDSIINFRWNNSEFTFSDLLEVAGKLPIPPYLNRHAEVNDDETYQTVYSHIEGSVAAPTAGLHFTTEILSTIKEKGTKVAEVTLHVGAGTFKPVKADVISSHEMHSEFFSVSKETIKNLINHTGKVVVVGTTSMRTLESLYYIGKKLIKNPNADINSLNVGQWEPYEESNADIAKDIDPKASLKAILQYLESSEQKQITSSTQLMIVPGYEFHYPDALITNFHQPQSTLLLLVSAFAGEGWRSIYNYALDNNFRFLSYGDGSLIWKKPK